MVVGSDSNSIRLLNVVARDLQEEAEVQLLQDASEALDFLKAYLTGNSGDRAMRPQLILLDVVSDGTKMRDFLSALKSNAGLRRIPTIALLGPGSSDLGNFYELNCNSVVPKPTELNAFIELLRALKKFWLGVVTLSRD